MFESENAEGLIVRAPSEFVRQVHRNELFVNNGFDLLLRDAEAPRGRLFKQHAKDTVLVDCQSYDEVLSNTTV